MQQKAKNFISDEDAARLIAAHDGDVALLYIWLSQNGDFDAHRAAKDLCRTLSEINAAHEKLLRLAPEAPAPAPMPAQEKLPPPEQCPEYTSADIVRRSQTDGGFTAVLGEAQRTLGRALSSADMKILFGIYDYLALPPEVIYELLHYCVQLFSEKYGSGRLPSMRSIEKEAYSWANKELLTLEQAEEYIKSAKERREAQSLIKEALGIRGRELTQTEQKYISSWMELGFDEKTLAVAYDRTVTNAGSLKWAYMNRIVQSWNEKGLKTVQDIEERDRRASAGSAAKPQDGPVQQTELERMRAIYNKVKNG